MPRSFSLKPAASSADNLQAADDSVLRLLVGQERMVAAGGVARAPEQRIADVLQVDEIVLHSGTASA
jgi:hypothetical protein